MDASLLTYLTETAVELVEKADGTFPTMADDMYQEASELLHLASVLAERAHVDTAAHLQDAA